MKTLLASILLALMLHSTSYATVYTLKHDPFEKPDHLLKSGARATNLSESNIELRGMILDGKNSMANISGKVVRLRQEIAGYTVTRIERNKVTLFKNGNITVLTVNDK